MNRKKVKKALSTEMTILIIVMVMMVAMSVISDTFFTAYNIMNMLKQAAIVGIIAIGMSVVLISGEIDLSVGASVGLSSMIAAMLISDQVGIHAPVPLAIAAGIASAILVGIVNGLIINATNIPSFIATIGTMTAVRGIIKLISDARTLSSLPKSFNNFAIDSFLGISNLVWVWLIIVGVVYLFLRFTVMGRNAYVVGSSNEVAELSGINVKRVKLCIYSMSGLLCGIAGILLLSRLQSALPTSGQGYETNAIAAAVIGGVSFDGAKGKVYGTLIGTILLVLIENGGRHLGLNSFVLEVINGIIIISAVTIDNFRSRKSGN